MSHGTFFPDFFIVGAPRCGTTALYRCLKSHPEVCFSRPKETHFFSKILPELPGADVRTDYLDRFFANRRPGQLVAEATVSYIYSATALRTIVGLNGNARFIAMVRNPLEMLPSFHQLMLLYGQEEIEDFAQAWALNDERAQGRALPVGCLDPKLLRYGEVGRLGKYVAHLFELVGRERCLVLLHDDFVADPRATYLRILAFLGLADDGRTEFPRAKETRRYRWRGLHRRLYRHPRTVEDFAQAVYRRARYRSHPRSPLRRLKKRLRGALIRLNDRAQARAPLSPSLRAELRVALSDDVARLGRLLERDLSHWLA